MNIAGPYDHAEWWTMKALKESMNTYSRLPDPEGRFRNVLRKQKDIYRYFLHKEPIGNTIVH